MGDEHLQDVNKAYEAHVLCPLLFFFLLHRHLVCLFTALVYCSSRCLGDIILEG